MNCQSFTNALHEYVEASLTPARRRAADVHLAECADCRRQLQQERATAQALSFGFRRGVQHLHLPLDFQERLLAGIPQEGASSEITRLPETTQPPWLSYLWPTAIAACVLLTSFRSVHTFPVAPTRETAQVTPMAAPVNDISIQYTFQVPTWTFHRDGNRVVDSLSYQTVAVSETIPAGKIATASQPTQRKMPL